MSPDKPSRNEEEYFALQEAELLRQRREAARDAAIEAERKSHYMKCPKCGHDLVTGKFDGIEIDQCPNCHGIWFDAGEAESLIRRDEGKAAAGVLKSLLKSFRGGRTAS